MTIAISEKKFEESIESTLLKNGYIKRNPFDLDKEYLLDSDLFLKFLEDSQIEKYLQLQEIFGSDIKEKILQAYEKEIDSESLIHVIRKGFSIAGIKLDCLFLKPVSRLNPNAELYYRKNILSVIRQATFNNENKVNRLTFMLKWYTCGNCRTQKSCNRTNLRGCHKTV